LGDPLTDGALSVVEVTREMVLDIGITEEHYELWTEMEVSAFFIRLRCNR
jgi:hypothetical protein